MPMFPFFNSAFLYHLILLFIILNDMSSVLWNVKYTKVIRRLDPALNGTEQLHLSRFFDHNDPINEDINEHFVEY